MKRNKYRDETELHERQTGGDSRSDIRVGQLNQSSKYDMGQKDWKSLLKWFLAMAIFVISAVLAVLWSQEQQRETQLRALSLLGVQSTCSNDPECLKLSNRVLSYGNYSEDPCSNFFSYSCGGFTSRRLPDPSSGFRSVPSELDAAKWSTLARVLEGSLDNDPLLADDEWMNIYTKLKTYYRTCSTTEGFSVRTSSLKESSDTQATESLSSAALRSIKDVIEQNIFQLSADDPNALPNLHASLISTEPATLISLRGSRGGTLVTGLFDLVVLGEYRPNYQRALLLTSPVLPFGVDYSNVIAYGAYKTQVAALLKDTYYSNREDEYIEGVVELITAFEKELHDIFRARPNSSSPDWVPLSISNLQQEYPNIMGNSSDGWMRFFRRLEVPENALNSAASIASNDFRIYAPSTTFFIALNTLISNTAFSTIQEYAAYCTLLQLGVVSQMHGIIVSFLQFPSFDVGFDPYEPPIAIGSALNGHSQVQSEALFSQVPLASHAYFDFKSLKSSSGAPISQTLVKKICLKDTMEKFPLALSRFFAKATLEDESREDLKQIVRDTYDAFRRRLNGTIVSTWMDSASLQTAHIKLNKLEAVVGLPESAFDIQFLNKLYSHVGSGSTTNHFDNVLEAVININIAQFKLWTDDFSSSILALRQDWTEVNAFYAKSYNKLILPMGFLQSPIYSNKSSLALKYGSVGFIVAHELSHAFDPTAVMHDQYGMQRYWISPQSALNFFRRMQCFIGFYSRLMIFGKRINGGKTASQNVADHAGVVVAHEAFKIAKQSRDVVLLPGLHKKWSDEQQFWLAVSQMFCEVGDGSIVQAMIESEFETHTVAPLRMNAAFALVKDFSSAYQCATGSSMSPLTDLTRCYIW